MKQTFAESQKCVNATFEIFKLDHLIQLHYYYEIVVAFRWSLALSEVLESL